MSNKMDTDGKVPKLRFPEFKDGPKWEDMRLDEICEVNPPAKRLPKKFVYIDLESVEAGVLLQRKILNLDSAPSRAQRLLQKGDILYQLVRPYQKNNYFFWPEDELSYVASTGYAQLRTRQSPTFLFYYLHIDTFVDKVIVKATGSNYPAINSGDLSTILIEIPDPTEQQKIADCLSSIDDLITAQTQKLGALKTHKKALMQQLFPAEDETVPRLRFPEFRNGVKWEEKTLGSIAEFYKGKGISKADVEQNGSTPCIRYGELYTKYGEVISTVESRTNLPISALFISKKNDLLIPSSGETKLDIATTSCVELDNIALGGDINVIRSKQNGIFLSYYLNATKKYQIEKIAQGDTVVHLYSSQLKGLRVEIPKLEEQQKIADCLSSVDELIMAQTQKLDALKAHKKGLMQQLFPSADDTAD